MQQSLFYVAEAATILHWSKTSDHIGRKPVILLGVFGLSVSMYCFGLSKTFWGLVVRWVHRIYLCLLRLMPSVIADALLVH